MRDPRLDETVRAVLGHLGARWGVDAAWIFGSQTRQPRPDSDIDLAVLFTTSPNPLELLQAQADLEGIAGAPVDVVDLDRASPIIAHQALKGGQLVADRVPRRRIDFVAGLPSRYEDLMILRRSMERTMFARLARPAHG